jgi:hypothetical protein
MWTDTRKSLLMTGIKEKIISVKRIAPGTERSLAETCG